MADGIGWRWSDGQMMIHGYGVSCSQGFVSLGHLHAKYTNRALEPTGWDYKGLPRGFDLHLSKSKFDHLNVFFVGVQVVDYREWYQSWGESYQFLVLPLWLFLIFAVPPLVWWRQRRKRLGGGRGFAVEAMATAAENSAQSSQRHEDHEEKTI